MAPEARLKSTTAHRIDVSSGASKPKANRGVPSENGADRSLAQSHEVSPNEVNVHQENIPTLHYPAADLETPPASPNVNASLTPTTNSPHRAGTKRTVEHGTPRTLTPRVSKRIRSNLLIPESDRTNPITRFQSVGPSQQAPSAVDLWSSQPLQSDPSNPSTGREVHLGSLSNSAELPGASLQNPSFQNHRRLEQSSSSYKKTLQQLPQTSVLVPKPSIYASSDIPSQPVPELHAHNGFTQPHYNSNNDVEMFHADVEQEAEQRSSGDACRPRESASTGASFSPLHSSGKSSTISEIQPDAEHHKPDPDHAQLKVAAKERLAHTPAARSAQAKPNTVPPAIDYSKAIRLTAAAPLTTSAATTGNRLPGHLHVNAITAPLASSRPSLAGTSTSSTAASSALPPAVDYASVRFSGPTLSASSSVVRPVSSVQKHSAQSSDVQSAQAKPKTVPPAVSYSKAIRLTPAAFLTTSAATTANRPHQLPGHLPVNAITAPLASSRPSLAGTSTSSIASSSTVPPAVDYASIRFSGPTPSASSSMRTTVLPQTSTSHRTSGMVPEVVPVASSRAKVTEASASRGDFLSPPSTTSASPESPKLPTGWTRAEYKALKELFDAGGIKESGTNWNDWTRKNTPNHSPRAASGQLRKLARRYAWSTREIDDLHALESVDDINWEETARVHNLKHGTERSANHLRTKWHLERPWTEAEDEKLKHLHKASGIRKSEWKDWVKNNVPNRSVEAARRRYNRLFPGWTTSEIDDIHAFEVDEETDWEETARVHNQKHGTERSADDLQTKWQDLERPWTEAEDEKLEELYHAGGIKESGLKWKGWVKNNVPNRSVAAARCRYRRRFHVWATREIDDIRAFEVDEETDWEETARVHNQKHGTERSANHLQTKWQRWQDLGLSWTADDNDKLNELHHAGGIKKSGMEWKDWVKINVPNRSVAAARGRYNRLFPGWTTSEIDDIHAFEVDEETDWEETARVHNEKHGTERSADDLQTKWQDLERPWTADDNDKLNELHHAGGIKKSGMEWKDWVKINVPNRSVAAARGRYNRLFPGWTAGEIDDLQALEAVEDVNWEEIATSHNQKHGTERLAEDLREKFWKVQRNLHAQDIVNVLCELYQKQSTDGAIAIDWVRISKEYPWMTLRQLQNAYAFHQILAVQQAEDVPKFVPDAKSRSPPPHRLAGVGGSDQQELVRKAIDLLDELCRGLASPSDVNAPPSTLSDPSTHSFSTPPGRFADSATELPSPHSNAEHNLSKSVIPDDRDAELPAFTINDLLEYAIGEEDVFDTLLSANTDVNLADGDGRSVMSGADSDFETSDTDSDFDASGADSDFETSDTDSDFDASDADSDFETSDTDSDFDASDADSESTCSSSENDEDEMSQADATDDLATRARYLLDALDVDTFDAIILEVMQDFVDGQSPSRAVRLFFRCIREKCKLSLDFTNALRIIDEHEDFAIAALAMLFLGTGFDASEFPTVFDRPRTPIPRRAWGQRAFVYLREYCLSHESMLKCIGQAKRKGGLLTIAEANTRHLMSVGASSSSMSYAGSSVRCAFQRFLESLRELPPGILGRVIEENLSMGGRARLWVCKYLSQTVPEHLRGRPADVIEAELHLWEFETLLLFLCAGGPLGNSALPGYGPHASLTSEQQRIVDETIRTHPRKTGSASGELLTQMKAKVETLVRHTLTHHSISPSRRSTESTNIPQNDSDEMIALADQPTHANSSAETISARNVSIYEGETLRNLTSFQVDDQGQVVEGVFLKDVRKADLSGQLSYFGEGKGATPHINITYTSIANGQTPPEYGKYIESGVIASDLAPVLDLFLCGIQGKRKRDIIHECQLWAAEYFDITRPRATSLFGETLYSVVTSHGLDFSSPKARKVLKAQYTDWQSSCDWTIRNLKPKLSNGATYFNAVGGFIIATVGTIPRLFLVCLHTGSNAYTSVSVAQKEQMGTLLASKMRVARALTDGLGRDATYAELEGRLNAIEQACDGLGHNREIRLLKQQIRPGWRPVKDD